MKKVVFLISFALIFTFLLSANVYAASTSEALTASNISELIINSDPVGANPPYSRDNFPQEYIEPLEGSLTLTEDILYLPGKNGLDLDLSVTYNSNNIGENYYYSDSAYDYIFEKKAYYYSYNDTDGEKQTILICPDNEEHMLEVAPVSFYATELPSVVSDYYNTKFYYLSQFDTEEQNILFTRELDLKYKYIVISNSRIIQRGHANTSRIMANELWKWNIPTIIEEVEPLMYEKVDGWKYYRQYTAMIDFDNTYSSIRFWYDNNPKTGENECFKSTIVGESGEYTSSYTVGPGTVITDNERGITYHFSVTDSQGRTMYFLENGYICAVEDRFGNIIKYTFTNDKLTQIVDTLGRIVTITYTTGNTSVYVDQDGSGPSEPELHVSFITTVTNNTELDPSGYLIADNSYTSSITKYEDANTPYTKTFDYNKRHQAHSSISDYKFHEPQDNICKLITKITHPNNLTTFYDYTRTEFTEVALYYIKHLYSLTQRRDVDGSTTYNNYTYTYTPGTQTVKKRIYDGAKETFTGSDYIEKKVFSKGDVSYTEEYEYFDSSINRKTLSTTQRYTGGSTRVISTPHDTSFRSTGTSYDDYSKTIAYFSDSLFVKNQIEKKSSNVFIKTSYTLSPKGDDYYTGRTINSMKVSESTDGGETYTEKYVVRYTYNPDGTLLSETKDPDGINQLTTYAYTYGSDGSITTSVTQTNLTDAEGNSIPDITTSSKVDYLGNLVWSKDGNGNETTYEYDSIGRLTKQINPDLTFRTYEYDTLNRTVILTDENSIMTKNKYNGFGDLTHTYKNIGSATSPQWALVSCNVYDALCRPNYVYEYFEYEGTSRRKWKRTFYTFDLFDNVTKAVVRDEALTILYQTVYTYNYADRIGASAELTAHDSTNGGASYKFTSVTAETTSADGITPPVVKQFFDRRNRLVKQIRTDGDNQYISTYTYDSLGNLLQEKDESAYSEFDVDYSKKYQYNYLSKVTREYNAEGNYISNTYDALGRQISTTDYMGNTTTYTYDSIGRLLSESAPVDDNVVSSASYYYDANSNLIKEVKATASGTVEYTYLYDNCNRLLSEFDGSTYTANIYDGNLLTKTVSGLSEYTSDAYELTPLYPYCNVTDYTYDSIGNLASETTFNGTTTYVTNPVGKVTSTTDPNGTTTLNTYDSMGNLASSSAGDDVIEYTYNAFNLLTSVSRGDETTTYTYDNFGRNITETTLSNVITRAYNTQGKVTSMTLESNGTQLQSNSYTYNILGNMTSASNGTDTVTYTYNANGLPTSEEKDVFITAYTYTPSNLIKTVTHTRRWTDDITDTEGYNTIYDVSAFSYTYAPDGNITALSDTRRNTTYNTSYVYDTTNRLTNAAITQGESVIRSWSYAYNNLGDRTSQTVTDSSGTSTQTTYTYTNHRLTSETTNGETTSYTYDANGNTLTKTCGDSVTTYTYTPRNEVSTVTTGGITYTYTYNASSLRTGKTANGVTTSFLWAGDNIIREEATAKATDYFYGVNRVSRTITGDAYTYNVVDEIYDEDTDEYTEIVIPVTSFVEYYAYDGRGNVVHTLNVDALNLYIKPHYDQSPSVFPEIALNDDNIIDIGELTMASSLHPFVRNYFYSPFGEIWQGEVSYDTNPFRYAGEYLDKETGNIYLRARYFSPTIGRFITVDPIKDGTNWYVYCGNNPIAFVDPSGLAEQYFKNPPQGDGTPENDAAILNDEGLLYMRRLQVIYSLAEDYDNQLLMDATHYQMVRVRLNHQYHKDGLDEILTQKYSWGNHFDPYVYTAKGYKHNVSFDYTTYTEFSADWENEGKLLGFASKVFSSMSDSNDAYAITGMGKVITTQTIGYMGSVATFFPEVFSKLFPSNNPHLISGDSKITITISQNFLSKNASFYFHSNESSYFHSINSEKLKNN